MSGLIRSAMTPIARPVAARQAAAGGDSAVRIYKSQSKSTHLFTVKNRSRTKRSDLVLMDNEVPACCIGRGMQRGQTLVDRTKSLVGQVTWGEYLLVFLMEGALGKTGAPCSGYRNAAGLHYQALETVNCKHADDGESRQFG